jgi:hypothetical protein
MGKPNGKAPPEPIDTSIVRIAGPADESEVYRLMLLAHAEISIFPHSNERVVWYVRRFLFGHQLHPDDTGPRGVIGVIGPVGALRALTMVGLGQYWYTDSRHLEEYLVFVDPEHRKDSARYGPTLIEWLKERSRSTGLPLLTGILSNHRTEAKVRLYQRMLPQIGAYFFYNPIFREVPVFHSDTVTGPGSMLKSSSLAL